MPPSSPDSTPERLRAFFTLHYDEIYKFAVRHNMAIDRWPHNTNVWALRFTPPKGGTAGITIRPASEETFTLQSHWYVDDYDAATRSIKQSGSPEYRTSDAQLRYALREALAEILVWRAGEWSSISKQPPGVQQFTREQFENMQIRWPQVRPSGDAR